MSWQVKWKVPFEAKNNKKYVVDILEDVEETVETAYLLYGAENPFETSETNSEEYFLPIRSQTGYIRIVDKDGKDRNGLAYDWHEIIPDNNTHHQVRLIYEHGNSRDIVWIGYMKAEMFTTQTFAGTEELAFPVICPIGLLELSPLTFSSNITSELTVLTVAQIIHMALNSTGIEWQNVYVSRILSPSGSQTINDDLNARLSLMNFTDAVPELSQSNTVATWVDTKPMSDIIESVFRFWGWTLFSRSLDIYIVASGAENYQGTYRKFSFTQLASEFLYTNSTDEYVPQTLNLAEETNDKALKYMSTENYEDYVLGKRKIKIQANVNEKQIVIAPKFEELSYYSQSWANKYPDVYYDSNNEPKYYSFKFNLQNTGTLVAQLHDIIVNVTPKSISAYSGETVLSLDDTWGVDSEKTEFNLRKNIEILWEGMGGNNYITGYYYDQNTGVGSGPKPTQALLKLSTIHSLCIPKDSMISITASARGAIDPQVPRQFFSNLEYVYMQVKVNCKGSVYSWSTTVPTYTNNWQDDPTQGTWGEDGYIRVPINNFNKIKTTKQLPIPFYGASGLCIRMLEGQSQIGRLEISVLDNPSRNTILDNIQVKIVPKDDMMFPKAKSVQTYTGVANETFKEDLNVSLDIASGDSNKYGFGQLFNNNCTYLTALRFYGDTQNMAPEQHLLNRMISAYGKKRNRLQIVVKEDTYNNSESSIKAKSVGIPATTFVKNYDENQNYMIQAVDHNWKDSTMKLTLIERD